MVRNMRKILATIVLAASLLNPMKALGQTFEKLPPARVQVIQGRYSALMKKIKNGGDPAKLKDALNILKSLKETTGGFDADSALLGMLKYELMELLRKEHPEKNKKELDDLAEVILKSKHERNKFSGLIARVEENKKRVEEYLSAIDGLIEIFEIVYYFEINEKNLESGYVVRNFIRDYSSFFRKLNYYSETILPKIASQEQKKLFSELVYYLFAELVSDLEKAVKSSMKDITPNEKDDIVGYIRELIHFLNSSPFKLQKLADRLVVLIEQLKKLKN